jgi:hypothetical protein
MYHPFNTVWNRCIDDLDKHSPKQGSNPQTGDSIYRCISPNPIGGSGYGNSTGNEGRTSHWGWSRYRNNNPGWFPDHENGPSQQLEASSAGMGCCSSNATDTNTNLSGGFAGDSYAVVILDLPSRVLTHRP